MLEQIAGAASRPTGQGIQMGRDLSSKPRRALRQHHAEFGEHATHPVVDRGPLVNETLPCPMQAQSCLLMFILQWHETHARTRQKLTRSWSITS